MRTAAAMTAVLLCCVAADASAQQPAQRGKDAAAIINTMRGIVRDRMLDPEAARFKGEFLSSPEEDQPQTIKSLCGQVNGKNAMGGYTGFARFILTTDGMLVFEATEPRGSFNPVWLVWCARPI